jgi:hypothetical protein
MSLATRKESGPTDQPKQKTRGFWINNARTIHHVSCDGSTVQKRWDKHNHPSQLQFRFKCLSYRRWKVCWIKNTRVANLKKLRQDITPCILVITNVTENSVASIYRTEECLVGSQCTAEICSMQCQDMKESSRIFCGLFWRHYQQPDYIASNGKVTDQWWIGKDLQGSCHASGIYLEGLNKTKKMKPRFPFFRDLNRAGPNKIPVCYHYTTLFCGKALPTICTNMLPAFSRLKRVWLK